MDVKEIKELLKAFDESSSSYLQMKQDGFEVTLKKQSADLSSVPFAGMPMQPAAGMQMASSPAVLQDDTPAAVQEDGRAEEEPAEEDLVRAPLVGVFYESPSPEEKPYVMVGDSVKKGQVLCLVEAMKMMSEITAPRDGVIREIYVKNQDVVGFGDKLFRLQ